MIDEQGIVAQLLNSPGDGIAVQWSHRFECGQDHEVERALRVGYARMPRWADDGHADYVARDIDLGAALRGFKSGARELDPARSGLYIRYHLLVAFMLQRQGMTATDLIQTVLPLEVVEHQLSALKDW